MTVLAIRQTDESVNRDDRGWLKTQGYTAPFNLIALFVALLIFVLLLQHQTPWASTLFLYGKRYKLACSILFVLILFVAYIIYHGGRSNNRRLCMIFVVCLVLAELGAQQILRNNPFYMPYNTPHPYLGFSGKVRLQAQNKRLAFHMGGVDAPASISLNELGYRGPLPAQDKKGEYRIIMLGGSTVFVGSPLKNTLPGQLETLLNDAGLKHVCVYNWGLVSGVSGQELSAITHRAIDFDPDLIVVYNGSNDSNAPMNYDPRPGFPYNYYVSEIGQQFSNHVLSPRHIALPLLQKSCALRFLLGDMISLEMNSLTNLRQQYGYDTDPWRDEIAKNYGDNLSRMATVCRGSGAKLAVFLQPLFTHKNHPTHAENKILLDETFLNHIQYTYPRLSVAASRSLGGREDEGVYFSDISHILKDVKEELFWDYVHVNNLGNELIAREIAERIAPVIRDDLQRMESAESLTLLVTSPERPQP